MSERRRRSLVERLARRLGKLFFRRVELVGEERLPSGPALYVANHGNGLIDPMLLSGWLPPGVRFLAKSTLWSHPVVGPFVRLAGAIPVYRRQDAGADVRRNRETFATAWEALAEGRGIGIFPEGVSAFEPGLLPLKSGAARIVLGAEAAAGPLGVVVVPVGFSYEARDRFRSRVLIQIGEPLTACEGLSAPFDSPANVRRLTARIDAALRSVTLNFDSWEEARLLRHAAEIFSRPELEVPERASLASRFATHRAFSLALPEIAERWPERTARVRSGVRRYERLLRRLRVDDAQVVSNYPVAAVLRFAARNLGFLAVWLPLAVIGWGLNFLPYRLPGWIVSRLRLPTSDVATWKIFLGLFLFPLAWAAEGWVAYRRFDPWAALAVGILAPATGFVALRYSERFRGFLRQARAYLTLLRPGRTVREIRRCRSEIQRQMEELEDLYRALPRPGAPP